MLRLVALSLLALPGLASAAPDFEVVSVQGRCHSVSRFPAVLVEVINTGDLPDKTTIDVFVNPLSTPVIGDISPYVASTGTLQPGASGTYEIELFGAPYGHNVPVHVLLNTRQDAPELDLGDNWGFTWADFWDCK